MSGDNDPDEIADALAHPVRREIVEHLQDVDGEGLRYLSIVVTKQEAARRGVSISSVGFDRVQEEIVNEHVPVLEDAGLLHYNPTTEWVEMDGTPGKYLDSSDGEE